MQEPSVHGRGEHCNRVTCWGAEGGFQDQPLGTTALGATSVLPVLASDDLNKGDNDASDVGDDPPTAPIQHPKLSQCLTITEDNPPSTDSQVVASVLALDFGEHSFQCRTEDKTHWPPPNPKAITSRKSLPAMMMTRHMTSLLAMEGRIPVIVSPNPKDPELSVETAFGPMLDSNHQPCKPGAMFLASTIYKKFHLKKGKGFNDAWSPDVWQAGCGILRLPEKNGLPFDVPIANGMSPLGEVMRIVACVRPIGFFFFGSGGVPVVNGFVSPSAGSKAATDSSGARDGATFEAAQTVANKVNFAMDQLCELGTPIAFFVSGKALPVGFCDRSLQEGQQQAMHLGTHRVMQCAQEDPLDKEAMNQMVAFCKQHCALDPCMLRFHLEHRKKHQAHPVLHEPQPHSHLRVDKRDDRKPLFEVSHNESYQTLLSPEATNFISEKTMVSEWIADGHHLELLDFPYQEPGTPRLDAANGISIVQPATRRPLKKRMAHLAKRKITFDRHWETLLKASTVSFARLLEIDVDADGKIGPLIDVVPSIHTAGSELANCSHFFWQWWFCVSIFGPSRVGVSKVANHTPNSDMRSQGFVANVVQWRSTAQSRAKRSHLVAGKHR